MENSAIKKSKTKIAVAFFASSTYGSELRSGFELLNFAARHGFNVAITSDIEKNDDSVSLGNLLGGVTTYVVPSLIKQHKLLYRFTDFIPQIIWHYRVARLIKQTFPDREVVWIINGAQPWLPLKPYIREGVRIIWGPIGGGEGCPDAARSNLPPMARLRESLRDLIQYFAIRLKAKIITQQPVGDIVPIARTSVAGKQLVLAVKRQMTIPTIPEILNPLKAARIVVTTTERSPKFVWVGQNIPRKNIQLAINIFTRLRENYFPTTTLDIYGTSSTNSTTPGVCFHGWVSSVDWEKYTGTGVLLITSYREGMPSVLLEAIRSGLLCISTEVGSIGEIECPTLVTLPMNEYPEFSMSTIDQLHNEIASFLQTTEIIIPNISFENRLHLFLFEANIITTPPSIQSINQ